MNITAIQAKATPKKGQNINLPVTVGQDEEGFIVIRIPQRMRADVVHESKTDKAVPMITLVPKYADGRSGNVNMPIVVTEDNPNDPENPIETVFGLRLGAFNGFVTA